MARVEALGHWSDLADNDGSSAEHGRRAPGDLQLHRRYKGRRRTQYLLTNLTEQLIEPTTPPNASNDARSGMAEQDSLASRGPVSTAW